MDYVWLNFSVWFCHLLLFCFIKIAVKMLYWRGGAVNSKFEKKKFSKCFSKKKLVCSPVIETLTLSEFY